MEGGVQREDIREIVSITKREGERSEARADGEE